MINYFLKVTICWGLFYLIYTMFLSKETFFKINRWYLLGTLLLGLIIPIIPFNFSLCEQHIPTAAIYVEPLVEQVQIVDTIIAVQAENGKKGYGLVLLWLVYTLGVLFGLFRFGKGLWKIHQLYQTASIHKKGSYQLVLTNQLHLPFSFFNYLFWSQGTHIEEKDAGTIITHEVAHINQWHSLDTLFLEWLGIFLWFSPPIYWYKKSLKDIHEYLADACVLKDTKTKQYGHLLLKQAQSGMQLALASHFLDSQLKKRIIMMTRNQSSNQALMKYLSALPLLVLMILVFSNPQVRANLNATAQLSIDYFNPNMEVPKISPSLLLWIGGDFDKEKARKVLEAAYVNNNNSVLHVEILPSGKRREVRTTSGHIKELHKAAIFLVRKFPAHKTTIHELAIATAKEEGIALRFHKNGESIIYQEINPAQKKPVEDFEMLFDSQSNLENWNKRLVLINNEVAGFYPKVINKIGSFRIPKSSIIEIEPKEAISMFGEELGKNGAVNFLSEEFTVVEEADKTVVKRVLENLKIPTSSEKSLLFVNGMPIFKEQLSLSSIPEEWVQESGTLNKEDLFLRGFTMGDPYEKAYYVTLIDEYTIVKHAWGEVKILTKADELNAHYEDKKKLFLKVDKMPRLTSCLSQTSFTEQENCSNMAFLKYIYSQIKYPVDARENGIEGIVKVQFTVELDGTISNPTIIKSIAGLDEEVLRIYNNMNTDGIRWQPGHHNGEDVRVVLTKPISFRIEKEDINKADASGETLNPLTISVSPNPSQGPILLSIKGKAGSASVTVVDMLGRELYSKELVSFSGTTTETIDLKNTVKGMVVVTVRQGTTTWQEKVLIQ